MTPQPASSGLDNGYSGHELGGQELRLAVPAGMLDAIADLVEARVLERLAELEITRSMPDYLTVAEAAERLRASRQRVYDLLSSGRLRRFKDGTRVLVSRAELDGYLRRR